MNRSRDGVLIAPSILSADFLRLGEDIAKTERAGADWHHVDVMDGHFVPNLSLGLPLIKSLKTVSNLPLDVHIMISNPDEYVQRYVEAGADRLTFHIEASVNPLTALKKIRSLGAKAGVSLNPDTPAKSIEKVLPYVDQVLVMSVHPGFGGQKFLENSLAKIADIKKMLGEIASQALIVVDGGVHGDNFQRILRAGADVLVAGSYVYGADDRQAAINKLSGS